MKKTGSFRKLLNLGRLARDEEGTVLIYVSIALTVFMGFAALVIDGSRLFTMDTEMQSAADALALAGAAELDGNSDAIDRAKGAMNNLVQNYETFGNRGTAITGYKAHFLTALPADDSEPINYDDLETTVGGEARFVEVRLQQEAATETEGAVDNRRSISNLFASAIGGGSTSRAGAVAVAGFTQAVCKFTPLFMCNPYENAGIDTYAEFSERIAPAAEKRKVIALKRQGAGAKYTPGNFGFLDPGGDDTDLKQSLAKTDPGTCFKQSGVSTKPGSKVAARQPLNIRFDLYEGSFRNGKPKGQSTKYVDLMDYRPAKNVTKGMTTKGGSVCNPDDPSVPSWAKAFPVDSNLVDNSVWLGNGDWGGVGGFDNYWLINHPGVGKPNSWSQDNLPSRYEVYRWEIENGKIPDNSSINHPKGEKGENGHPKCSGVSQQVTDAPKDDPDRRVIYAAIINCNQHVEELKGASAENIPVVAFVKMFMTQPITAKGGHTKDDEDVAADNTLYVEMIDIVQPGNDDAVVHDVVQLYR